MLERTVAVSESAFGIAEHPFFERLDINRIDALNHIFAPADLQRIFDNVSGYLNAGGLFVFDLLRESEIPPDEPFELEYSDTVRAVFRTSRLPGDAVRLHIQVFENGVPAIEEDILEKLHDPDMIRAMLERDEQERRQA